MTAAVFKLDGTTPEARDALMMFTIGWQRMGRQAFTRVVGIRSSLLVEDLAEEFFDLVSIQWRGGG